MVDIFYAKHVTDTEIFYASFFTCYYNIAIVSKIEQKKLHYDVKLPVATWHHFRK